MKYIITLIFCTLLIAGCSRPKIDVYPTGTYDTLGIQWMTIERDHIFYYFQGTGTKAASIYTDLHEDAYQKINQVFDAKMPTKLHFFAWTNEASAELALGHSLGFAISNQCVCHSMANQTLGHEMTHVITYWAGGIPPTSFTRFVNEGVAVAFNLVGDDKISTAKNALKGQDIHSIVELWSGSQQDADESVFYPVAGAFMQYLYNLNENDHFLSLIKHQTIEDAQNIYGKDRLEGLIADFNSKVGL